MLEQAFAGRLSRARRVLLMGCGGGYDVFGVVPLLPGLADREVSIANVSFCNLERLAKATRRSDHPNLFEVRGQSATPDIYCPEAWLARFLEEKLGRSAPIFAFEKTGVRPLRAALTALCDELRIDTLVLVDGGIDSLLRGDESVLGTPEEDLTSLAAALEVPVEQKLLACVGFGAELRDGICHEQVFDRIAALTREGAYLGASALVAETPAAKLYREAVEFTFAGQANLKRSHIHDVVLASVLGEYTGAATGKFDRRGPHVWVSPLLSLYWFFDAAAVAQGNLIVPHLRETETIWQATTMIEAVRKTLPIRDRTRIPI